MMFVNLAMDKMRCMSENQSGINYKILSSHQCYSTTTITATITTLFFFMLKFIVIMLGVPCVYPVFFTHAKLIINSDSAHF